MAFNDKKKSHLWFNCNHKRKFNNSFADRVAHLPGDIRPIHLLGRDAIE